MRDSLTRAQHYRHIARQYQDAAANEPQEEKRRELVNLAGQYAKLADRLIPSS